MTQRRFFSGTDGLILMSIEDRILKMAETLVVERLEGRFDFIEVQEAVWEIDPELDSDNNISNIVNLSNNLLTKLLSRFEIEYDDEENDCE